MLIRPNFDPEVSTKACFSTRNVPENLVCRVPVKLIILLTWFESLRESEEPHVRCNLLSRSRDNRLLNAAVFRTLTFNEPIRRNPPISLTKENINN